MGVISAPRDVRTAALRHQLEGAAAGSSGLAGVASQHARDRLVVGATRPFAMFSPPVRKDPRRRRLEALQLPMSVASADTARSEAKSAFDCLV